MQAVEIKMRFENCVFLPIYFLSYFKIYFFTGLGGFVKALGRYSEREENFLNYQSSKSCN